MNRAVNCKYIFWASLAVLVLALIQASSLTPCDHHQKIDYSPIVFTNYGYVQGTVLKSRNGRSYFSYKGMPYATPPVGDLRFKSPVEPQTWKGVRSAVEHGPICMQKNDLFDASTSVIGSEDCLYINVYAPEVVTNTDNVNLLPVMFLMHYGGYFSGNGNDDTLGPEYFMDKDVIVVTFNYRLGILGFLSTGDDASPGNYALKDQVQALKWVKENIVNFGGDFQRVTIFGQSAGGGSVHHHVLSPSSKGLFHAAIAQSGSALDVWAYPIPGVVAKEGVTRAQAMFVGCNSNGTSQELVDCLRSVSAEDLVDSIDRFRFFQKEPITIYTPVLEVKTELNPEPFIVETPTQIISEGKFNHVPFIIGVVEDEGILRASPLLRNSSYVEELNLNFNEYFVQMMGMQLSFAPENIPGAFQKIVQEYLGTNNIDVSNPSSVQGFVNLYSDRVFVYGSYQSALAHALNGHHPLWFYKFNYKGMQTYGDVFALTDEDIAFNWGVSHCDDLLYLFKTPKYFDELQGNDCLMTDIMIDLWTNFATYGHPTPNNEILGTIGLSWDPIGDLSHQTVAVNSDLLFLNISGSHLDTIVMASNTGFLEKRMSFWTSLGLKESFPNVQ